jgi:hypothetical protein
MTHTAGPKDRRFFLVFEFRNDTYDCECWIAARAA